MMVKVNLTKKEKLRAKTERGCRVGCDKERLNTKLTRPFG